MYRYLTLHDKLMHVLQTCVLPEDFVCDQFSFEQASKSLCYLKTSPHRLSHFGKAYVIAADFVEANTDLVEAGSYIDHLKENQLCFDLVKIVISCCLKAKKLCTNQQRFNNTLSKKIVDFVHASKEKSREWMKKVIVEGGSGGGGKAAQFETQPVVLK